MKHSSQYQCWNPGFQLMVLLWKVVGSVGDGTSLVEMDCLSRPSGFIEKPHVQSPGRIGLMM